ncbi:MAG: hypothetical protein HY914_18675 [Desulfomonile tiedjei]|nr:hypothetical protein [Desulfomonile tiedjei]
MSVRLDEPRSGDSELRPSYLFPPPLGPYRSQGFGWEAAYQRLEVQIVRSTVTQQLKRRSKGVSVSYFAQAVGMSFLSLFVVSLLVSPAFSDQTREQCEECCRKGGYDEYYLEQCRLFCYRHPDHCTGNRSSRLPGSEVAPKVAPKPEPEPEPAPTAAEAPAPKFRWPTPLNLVPGRERDAAAQILTLNGIPPQNPNFMAAVQQMEQVLIGFVRANPQGGRLPTAQLERILRQFKQTR